MSLIQTDHLNKHHTIYRFRQLATGLLFTAFLFLASCKQKVSNAKEEHGNSTLELMNTDIDFSKKCNTLGTQEAFMQMLDSNGVLLRQDRYPIAGGQTTDYLIENEDPSLHYSFVPSQAEVASSGDLGYTYGIFKCHLQSADTVYCGTYTHIWKRHNDGKWKLMLNTLNWGLGE